MRHYAHPHPRERHGEVRFSLFPSTKLPGRSCARLYHHLPPPPPPPSSFPSPFSSLRTPLGFGSALSAPLRACTNTQPSSHHSFSPHCPALAPAGTLPLSILWSSRHPPCPLAGRVCFLPHPHLEGTPASSLCPLLCAFSVSSASSPFFVPLRVLASLPLLLRGLWTLPRRLSLTRFPVVPPCGQACELTWPPFFFAFFSVFFLSSRLASHCLLNSVWSLARPLRCFPLVICSKRSGVLPRRGSRPGRPPSRLYLRPRFSSPPVPPPSTALTCACCAVFALPPSSNRPPVS